MSAGTQPFEWQRKDTNARFPNENNAIGLKGRRTWRNVLLC